MAKPALEARESNDGHDGNEWMCEEGCGYSGTYSDVEAHERTCDGKPPVEPPVESLDRTSQCRSLHAQVYHQVMKRIGPQVDALEATIGRLHRKLDRQDRELDRQAREITRLKRRMAASERVHGTSFARQPVDVRRRVRGGIKKGQKSKEKQRKLRRLYNMLDDGCCGRERYTQQPNPYVQAVDAYENLVPGARKVTTPTFE